MRVMQRQWMAAFISPTLIAAFVSKLCKSDHLVVFQLPHSRRLKQCNVQRAEKRHPSCQCVH